MKCLLVCLALCGLSAAQAHVCPDKETRWKQTNAKGNVSSSNVNDVNNLQQQPHYPTGDEKYYSLEQIEGLNRTVMGINSLLLAFQAEAMGQIDRLCQTIDNQQAEINELKTEVQALKQQRVERVRSNAKAAQNGEVERAEAASHANQR
jgi:hypothetical protein